MRHRLPPKSTSRRILADPLRRRFGRFRVGATEACANCDARSRARRVRRWNRGRRHPPPQTARVVAVVVARRASTAARVGDASGGARAHPQRATQLVAKRQRRRALGRSRRRTRRRRSANAPRRRRAERGRRRRRGVAVRWRRRRIRGGSVVRSRSCAIARRASRRATKPIRRCPPLVRRSRTSFAADVRVTTSSGAASRAPDVRGGAARVRTARPSSRVRAGGVDALKAPPVRRRRATTTRAGRRRVDRARASTTAARRSDRNEQRRAFARPPPAALWARTRARADAARRRICSGARRWRRGKGEGEAAGERRGGGSCSREPKLREMTRGGRTGWTARCAHLYLLEKSRDDASSHPIQRAAGGGARRRRASERAVARSRRRGQWRRAPSALRRRARRRAILTGRRRRVRSRNCAALADASARAPERLRAADAADKRRGCRGGGGARAPPPTFAPTSASCSAACAHCPTPRRARSARPRRANRRRRSRRVRAETERRDASLSSLGYAGATGAFAGVHVRRAAVAADPHGLLPLSPPPPHPPRVPRRSLDDRSRPYSGCARGGMADERGPSPRDTPRSRAAARPRRDCRARSESSPPRCDSTDRVERNDRDGGESLAAGPHPSPPPRQARRRFRRCIVAEGNERRTRRRPRGGDATAPALRETASRHLATAPAAYRCRRPTRRTRSGEGGGSGTSGPAATLADSGIGVFGGHSARAKVEAMYGVELPATAAFDYPSVEAPRGTSPRK